MPRVFVAVLLAGIFAAWSPAHGEISANKDCDGIMPVGGAVAPMHDANPGSVRNAGMASGHCKNQMNPTLYTGGAKAEAEEKAPEPVAAPAPPAAIPPEEPAAAAQHIDLD